MSYKLKDLIDMEQFQNLQDRLDEIYSFPAAIIDNDGNILTATAWQDICSQFHRKHPVCELECIQSDRYIINHLNEANPGVTYHCPRGLVDNAIPIIIGGIHYGNFFTGQFFLEKPDLEFFRAQAKKFGFEEEAYLATVRKVPIWTHDQLTSYLYFIKGLIDILSISGLKKLEEIEARKQIEESEERANTILGQMQDGFWITKTTSGQIVDANEAMCNMLGHTRDELLAMSVADFEVNDTPEDIARRIREIMLNGSAQFESRFRHKGGATIDVEISVTYLPNRELFFGFHRDITDRKREDKEKLLLQSQLIQAQKMESIGLLAGGVAHDFNNILGVILGNTELALARLDPAHPVYADLQEIRNAAQRSADLTGQLLAFARKQTVSPKVIDLNETVEGMLRMLRRLIGENIRLHWEPGKRLWPVKIDPSQVDQMLANLAVNARDAIERVGNLTIETENVMLDESYCQTHAGMVPGEYVMLSVGDDGKGMSPQMLSHIFEPFFTTKGLREGTGLGLATLYGIVKQNGGFIYAYSEPGVGSIFKVYLPRHAGSVALSSDNDRARVPKGGKETILLVEDDRAMLRLSKNILETLGHEVLAAATSDEAIRLAKEHAGEIQLLLTDVVMPDMNGRDLANHLLTLRPNIKPLFMSGYTANVIAQQGILDPGVQLIQKPFSVAGLAAKVREILDRDSGYRS